jgi:hypothetical protein
VLIVLGVVLVLACVKYYSDHLLDRIELPAAPAH